MFIWRNKPFLALQVLIKRTLGNIIEKVLHCTSVKHSDLFFKRTFVCQLPSIKAEDMTLNLDLLDAFLWGAKIMRSRYIAFG